MRRALTRVVMLAWAVVIALGVVGCAGSTAKNGLTDNGLVVSADTTFMADIAQNTAGDRLKVSAILPIGADPHSFEPTPKDARRIAESSAVVINAIGLVPQLDSLLTGVCGGNLVVIEAAAGLPGVSEDPHTWLDPLLVVTYVENIARGLGAVDPVHTAEYQRNAEEYSRTLRELDAWITSQVDTVAPERRLLVTNHQSFGYFAARYGFRVVGTVFPTVSGEGSPSAQKVAALIADIKTSRAPAIFLETGSNADLARQIAREAGVEVVDDLLVASLGDNASSYVEMMRWNVKRIVEALR